jgi:hypothetical protein
VIRSARGPGTGAREPALRAGPGRSGRGARGSTQPARGPQPGPPGGPGPGPEGCASCGAGLWGGGGGAMEPVPRTRLLGLGSEGCASCGAGLWGGGGGVMEPVPRTRLLGPVRPAGLGPEGCASCGAGHSGRGGHEARHRGPCRRRSAGRSVRGRLGVPPERPVPAREPRAGTRGARWDPTPASSGLLGCPDRYRSSSIQAYVRLGSAAAQSRKMSSSAASTPASSYPAPASTGRPAYIHRAGRQGPCRRRPVPRGRPGGGRARHPRGGRPSLPVGEGDEVPTRRCGRPGPT